MKKNVREKEVSLLYEAQGPAQKAKILFDSVRETKKKILFITPEGLEESRLFHDLVFFFTEQKVVNLLPLERLSSDGAEVSFDSLAKRKDTVAKLMSSEGVLVLSSMQACLDKVTDPVQEQTYSFCCHAICSRETLLSTLEEAGFQKVACVEERGQYASRGGVVDFFPLEGALPTRVELFDDVIESLRSFDPVAQRSVGTCEKVSFSSCQKTAKNCVSLLSLLPAESTLIVLDDIAALEDRYVDLLAQYKTSSLEHLSLEEWFTAIDEYQKLFFSTTTIEELSSVVVDKSTGSYSRQQLTFSLFNRQWKSVRLQSPYRYVREWYETESLLPTSPVKEQFVDCFLEHQAKITHQIIYSREQDKAWFEACVRERGGQILPSTIFLPGMLSESLLDIQAKTAFLTLHEILERATLPMYSSKSTKTYAGPQIEAFELEPGDLVIHYHQGLGRFFGIEKKPNIHGIEQEFFVLIYEDSAKLYVPFSQAHLLTKYIGASEVIPKLHPLGSTKWRKLREATEQAVIGYAANLLKVYAARSLKGGYCYPADGEMLVRFEADFPYMETEDQQKAIDDVKRDMCSAKAMDRLICGDVGYGKTEVALRAAFKAVVDGKKQVAILVPTTVLALQHYDTFCERMKAYGIRVGHVSRFVSAKHNKETIEKVLYGEIDILIGTHKILSKNVAFYDLGLVIIDEEQRFGVKAKEYLKLIKEGVDCLTLSATPIPRTLYLSMAGARDLSTINTPPYDRLPIKTIVAEPDDTLIRESLHRELSRGGQIFYIHNRVESIHETAARVRSLVPSARILVGHGRMDAEDLDAVFHAFREGQADILVSTTIVENGIDIPNANTIIIDRADLFGIAELYQLRGRVGRWNRRAFAYFLLPKRMLSEVAKKRIDAIAKASGYGGGFRVAMRDLEIRGAGDLLGTEQSGNVSSVGFHLYCKLLKRAVDALQGKTVISIETKIDVPFDAKIPQEYIDDTNERIDIYHRLGDVQSLGDVAAIETEVKDRFGKLPLAVQWLFAIAKVRVVAASKGVFSIRLEKFSLLFESKKGDTFESKRVIVSGFSSPQIFEKKMLELLG